MRLCRHKGSALKVTNWPDIRVREEKEGEYDDEMEGEEEEEEEEEEDDVQEG